MAWLDSLMFACITGDDLKIRRWRVARKVFLAQQDYIFYAEAFTDLPYPAAYIPTTGCRQYGEDQRMDFCNDPFYNVNIKRFFQVKY